MTPLRLLQQVISALEPHIGFYAIAGGLAASFYRTQPRLTNDVDIALCVGSVEASKEAALALINSLGYRPALGWIAGIGTEGGGPVALVVGREEGDDSGCSVDFLLPSLPWLEQAVGRAQCNLIDFGFAELPTITPEDLIIAKSFALQLEPNRFQDLDDIQSIFNADNELDVIYLVSSFEQLKVGLPPAVKEAAPKALRRACAAAQKWS